MSLQFSNTTTKGGIIQICERRTGLGDTVISGDATLLKQFASEANIALDEITPLVLASDSKWQWDDTNHTDLPIATTDVVAGQRSYSFTADENGNSILEIERVYLYDTVAGEYKPLDAIDTQSGSGEALAGISTGTPVAYDKLATAVFFNVIPSTSITNGLRVVFKRAPSYFASTDTTKTPGIPTLFHPLVPEIMSRNWVEVNKPENTVLLNGLNTRINRMKGELESFMNRRSKDEKTYIQSSQGGHR